MKTPSLLWTAAVALGAQLATVNAAAQTTFEQAKMLFSAGAKAYESGQFNAAIQAFEGANRLVPKPQIVFSIAQAHRRQYFLDKDPDHLRAAIKLYHEYVDAVKEGGRVADAAQALAELEPVAARTSADAASAPKPAPKEPARLMVLTQVEDATIAIDGRPAKPGLAVEVPAGKHHIVTVASGYFDDAKDVQAIDGLLVPVDVALREKPARLSVSGPSGAQITIDGRPMGTTPLPSAIAVSSGVHLVAVTKNGYRAFAREIDFSRDESKRVDVALEASSQRVVSYGLIVGGAAAIVAGGVFTAIAIKNQSDAQGIQDRRSTGTIAPADVDAYDAARGRRDDWTKGAIVAFAAGGVTAATGLVLYLFDMPVVTAAPPRPESPKKPAAPSPGREPMEMGFLPLVGPNFAGAGVSGRF